MRAGVIGLGQHGRRIASVVTQAGLELVAAVDQRAEALTAPEVPPGAARLTDAAAAFALGLDLVCINTHGPSHMALALQAMEAGVRRVMVEKPMGCSVAECDRMIATAQRTGTRLAVNQSRRHDPLYAWIAGRVREEAWGGLRGVWIQRPGIGLGCLGTHFFDLVRFLSGREVERVTAWVDPFLGPNPRGAQFVDPGGLVVLELAGGVRATVAQMEDAAGPATVELHFTGGRVRVEEQLGRVEVTVRDRAAKSPTFIAGEVPAGLSAKPNLLSMSEALVRELAGEGPLACEAREGLASVEILAAAHLSHARGHTPMALPLVGADRDHWMSIT